MADSLVVLDSVAQQWVLVSVQATDVVQAHALVAAFVVLLEKFADFSLASAVEAAAHLIADVQLQLLLLAVATS